MSSPKPAGKPLLRALGGEVMDRPPFWLMRQAGRYLPEYREVRRQAGNFLDLCLNPELAVEVTLQPIRRYGMDAAILFSDILIVPYGLGQKVAFREGEGPVLDALAGPAGLASLDRERFHDRAAPVYETVRRLAGALPAETALIGFAGAPWTVATYMVEGGSSRDFARTKRWAYADPESFSHLVDLLVETTAHYLSAQIRAGAEVVQLFDSWAGVLPEAAFRRWAIDPARRIVERLRAAHPEIPVIGFPRGGGVFYRAYAEETGVTAVSLDTTVPLSFAREALQSTVVVQGNLDPLLLVVGGRAMEEEVARIRAALDAGPFIFNLGHGIVPETPPEHVAALAELLRAPCRAA
jgi:uroporphyrinogen decarboxylase